MKYLVFVVFTLQGLAAAAADTLHTIVYRSTGMGGSLEITITKEKLVMIQKGFTEINLEMTLNTERWQSLEDEISLINLKRLKDLEAPTQNRHVDAAWYTTLTIQTSSGEYKTKDFDSGSPMAEISSLVQKIQTLITFKII